MVITLSYEVSQKRDSLRHFYSEIIWIVNSCYSRAPKLRRLVDALGLLSTMMAKKAELENNWENLYTHIELPAKCTGNDASAVQV
jgi:DNA mismatch repair protein MutH